MAPAALPRGQRADVTASHPPSPSASRRLTTPSPAFRSTELSGDAEMRTQDMHCRANGTKMRTFLVRALSFSAIAALTLNPALSPVIASDYRLPPAPAPMP